MGSRRVGFSICGTWALERRLSSCDTRALLLHGTWDLPGPGLEPVSLALAGRFLTTVPPGKSFFFVYFISSGFFFFLFSLSEIPIIQTMDILYWCCNFLSFSLLFSISLLILECFLKFIFQSFYYLKSIFFSSIMFVNSKSSFLFSEYSFFSSILFLFSQKCNIFSYLYGNINNWQDLKKVILPALTSVLSSHFTSVCFGSYFSY